MKKKVLSLCVCLLMATVALTGMGCSRKGPDDEPINQDATQLLVGNFDGGYGDAWLKEVKARFE